MKILSDFKQKALCLWQSAFCNVGSAAAVIVAAATAAVADAVIAPQQDDDQNDDPPPVAAIGAEAGRIAVHR